VRPKLIEDRSFSSRSETAGKYRRVHDIPAPSGLTRAVLGPSGAGYRQQTSMKTAYGEDSCSALPFLLDICGNPTTLVCQTGGCSPSHGPVVGLGGPPRRETLFHHGVTEGPTVRFSQFAEPIKGGRFILRLYIAASCTVVCCVQSELNIHRDQVRPAWPFLRRAACPVLLCR
jgi:hypothetical protein